MSYHISAGIAASAWAQQDTLQGRLALARLIARSFTVIGCLYLLAFNALLLFGHRPDVRQPPLFAVDAIVAVSVVVLASMEPAIRSERVHLVAGLIVGALGLSIGALEMAFVLTHVLDPLALTSIGGLLMVIVLAGAMGDWPLVIGTTLLANALAIILLVLLARLTADATLRHHIIDQWALLGPQVLLQQWGVATIVLIVSRGVRGIFVLLGATQMAVEQARKLDDLKDQFIASVNHELRNPVMAMLGYLDIIDLSLEQGKTERLPEHIRSAMRSGFALRDLINSILDTSRQDQGAQEFIPSPVDVAAAVAKARNLLEVRERDRLEPFLRVAVPDGLTLWGDQVRLQQILTNLLSNAAKYAPPGTRVEVTASVVQIDPPRQRDRRRQGNSEMVEIVVRDAGLGIPPDQI
ncbi:MAG TPA: HAMP domain-containing sensor histidine kinase, partial [Ktedonobacterales bacterium]|nr:HAMP domain-containing sensor histidine kinase [Ktedonobacterales bacterium]